MWLDAMLMNTGHTLRKGWTDNTVEGTIRVPLGQEGRCM